MDYNELPKVITKPADKNILSPKGSKTNIRSWMTYVYVGILVRKDLNSSYPGEFDNDLESWGLEPDENLTVIMLDRVLDLEYGTGSLRNHQGYIDWFIEEMGIK